MDLRFVLVLIAFVAGVCCQYDVQQVIDQTQYLQQIEKYGTNHTSNRVYPSLNNLTDIGHGFGVNNQRLNVSEGGFVNHNLRNNNSRGGFNDTSGVHPDSFNATERFLNKTISSMSKGVCVKEVPTASLLRRNEVVVAGNGSTPSLSIIQVCCEGYQRNIYNFRKCDPICRNECVNGYCAAPDTCVCFPDHVINFGGFCIPTCPIMCGNGFCNRYNTCTCKDGYDLEPNGKFCFPKCLNGCFNGNCTAPEECTCNKGFTISSTGKCEAYCSQGCKHGDCVGPDVCSCHKGYEKVNNICQPICSRGCSNGICVAPELCQCTGNGWSLDASGSQCVASCDKPCLNGVCTGPNQCTCRTGFASDSFDPFRCVPKCDPPCVNGVCSGPNLCLCYQGFVKDRSVKGSQKCIKY